MGLFSFFKRPTDPDGAAAVTDTGDAVQQARTRARRRLIGAVVLLVIGVIGFPLVFETRPRPIPVDIPIEIPRKDGAPALVMPPARSAANITAAPAGTLAAPEIITESSADAGRDVGARAPASATSATERAASRPILRPAQLAEAPQKPAASAPPSTVAEESRKSATPTSAAAPEATRKTATAPSAEAARKSTASPALAAASRKPASASAAVDGARAKALLDAKPVAEGARGTADGGRFVVQIGAFAETESARETRVKAEKLGLKTYTQVAQTPSGSRIRVRLGPFASRAEADAALAKARSAGLTAVVLTL